MNWAEFWSGVVSVLNTCWDVARTILPVMGDICLFVISVYTFRITVLPKKLRFIGFTKHSGAFTGESLSITLENRSLSPVVVESVDLVVKSNLVNVFSKNDGGECIIIEGFKTTTIKMEPYSSILSGDNSFKIDIFALKDMFLLVKTSRDVQRIKYARTSKLRHRMNQRRKAGFTPTIVCRNSFNGKLIVPQAKYALSYIDRKGEMQTFFIHNSGAMSAAPFGYNGLPKELVDDENALRTHFEAEFSARKLSYHLERVNDFGASVETTGDVIEQ